MAQSPASGGLPAVLAPDAPMPAMSDPRAADTALAQAQRLADEGRPDDALAAIEIALKESPSDVRLRFLKGVILSGHGKDAAAIAVFQGLTRQFPELPEPHNNLAALHAARGELDLARAALDEAVRALPSYALAHENLGDLHLRLAMRSWQRAAELEPANVAAASKLRLARELSQRIAPPVPGAAPLPGSR
jgi:tetratricopeptide (TPR) repeat protein